MDQERWQWAQCLQLSKSCSNDSSSPTNTCKRTANKQHEVKIDRYKYDMEQAEAMKKGSFTLRGLERRGGGSSKDILQSMTIDDVLLGLNGLDQADEYKVKKQYHSALKLYELSLELLIKYLGLKDNTTIQLPDGVSRSTIETRVYEALAEAEAIKKIRIIQDSEAQQQQTISLSTQEASNTSSISVIWSAIDGALQRLSGPSDNDIDRSNTSVATVLSRSRPITLAASNQQQRTTNRQNPTRIVQATNKTITMTQRRQPQQQHRRLNPSLRSNNIDTIANTHNTTTKNIANRSELHGIIIRDFYVPTSSLQKTSWDDIAGLQSVKQALQEAAILPLIRPDLFTGLRKPRNILLYGPPGTGKTLLVKAVANESQSRLLIVTSSALTSKWMGETEKLVKCLFEVARDLAPSIIFIDEIDALLSTRKSSEGGGEHEASRRLKTEFMIQMDGIIQQLQVSSSTNNNAATKNVLLLACTNCPWDIDSAVIRRFPRRIYVPLPDSEARTALLRYLLDTKMGNHSIQSTKQINTIVRRTDGYSCSDITAIASEAAFGPIRELSVHTIRDANQDDIRPINISDFDNAIQNITKSVTTQQLQKYDQWNKQQQATS